MKRVLSVFSGWGDYLAGMLLGAIIGGFLVDQARSDELAQINIDHSERVYEINSRRNCE